MQKDFLSKLLMALAALSYGCQAVAASAESDEKKDPTATVIAVGIGVERTPSWLGAATHQTNPVPYLDIRWRDQVEFSTVDGLSIDLLHSGPWRGGLVGTVIWNRSKSDLGVLANRVNTLNSTVQAGTYLEYALSENWSMGARWRHDLQGTGAAYGDVYTELDLTGPGPVTHSLKLNALATNGAAMRRFFGVSTEVGMAIGTPAYQPGGGFSTLSATYQVFLPVSKHAGLSLAADWSRLTGAAALSPLVQNFGSRNQRSVVITAIYQF